jgi:hypothetical protein
VRTKVRKRGLEMISFVGERRTCELLKRKRVDKVRSCEV